MEEPKTIEGRKARERISHLTKPLRSMGDLEDIAVKLADLWKEERPSMKDAAAVIFCGDTAVDGVNQTKGRLSYNEAALVASGYAPVNVAARERNIPVYLIDVGLEKDTDAIPGMLHKKVIHGTHQGHPAMDEDVVKQAVSTGMAVAHTLVMQGVRIAALGHIGERSMLSALSVTTAALKKELEKASRKTGFQLQLSRLGNLAEDPIGVLASVGSAEIAALFGFIVEAAENRMAILFDDGVTGAAVLAAVTVYPEIRSAVFPTLIYHEPVHEMQMKSLGMEGMIDLDITGGAGLGSVMGLSLLMAAMSMMEHMKTFEETGVAGREEKGDGK